MIERDGPKYPTELSTRSTKIELCLAEPARKREDFGA
jgi:hypothetical protein